MRDWSHVTRTELADTDVGEHDEHDAVTEEPLRRKDTAAPAAARIVFEPAVTVSVPLVWPSSAVWKRWSPSTWITRNVGPG